MNWKDILKINMDEARNLGRKYAPDDMREEPQRHSEEELERIANAAHDKALPIIDNIMEGIETFEEQSFSPREIGSNDKEIYEMEEEYVSAEVYDTMFGRVSFTVTTDGKVLDGYFNGGEITNWKKKHNELWKLQEKEFAGKTQRSQIGYAETPEEYYHN